MADKHTFQRRATGGISVLTLGLLLALVIHLYHRAVTTNPLKSIVARHVDSFDLPFGGLSDSLTNATLDKRQSFNCGPGNPCSNGACCGGSGYCGYGEKHTYDRSIVSTKLTLDRSHILWIRLRLQL